MILGEDLKRLDEEAEEFYEELHEGVTKGDTSLEELLGFRMRESKVFVSGVCPVSIPSFYSLLPLYDTAIFPVYSKIGDQKITRTKIFREIHHLTPEEISLAAKEEHLVLYFLNDCVKYDADMIEPLLEPGVPIVGNSSMGLLQIMSLCKFVDSDCDRYLKLLESVQKDFPETRKTGSFVRS